MVVKRRIVRQGTMDKTNTDLSFLMRHFEMHNKQRGSQEEQVPGTKKGLACCIAGSSIRTSRLRCALSMRW